MRRLLLFCLVPFFNLLAPRTPLEQKDNRDAMALLERVADTYHSARSFQIEGTSVVESENAGMHGTMDFPFKADFVAPAKMRIENQNSVMGVLIVSDGRTIWVYMPSAKTYSEIEIATMLESAPKNQDNREALAGAAGASGLLFDVFQLSIRQPMERAAIIREEQLQQADAKIACYVVRAEYRRSANEAKILPKVKTYWIDKDRYVVVRESWESRVESTTTKTTTTLTRVRLNQPVRDEIFKFTPPEGARQGEGLRVHQ